VRAALGRVGRVVAWLVILGVAVVLAAAVLVPRLAGATPYTVLTGSMRPHYPPGTLVVVKPVDPRDVRVGDVVTYQLESGKPEVVTHRVVRVATSLDGHTTFTTQGDANDVPDDKAVRPVQVQGRLWYSVPYLGYVNEVLTGRQRQTAVYVVAGGLTAYALYMFAGALHGRFRKEERVVVARRGRAARHG
jgi:signal peptidase